MSTVEQERIGKLPAWAQSYIALLKQEKAELSRQVATLFSDKPSNTVWANTWSFTIYLQEHFSW